MRGTFFCKLELMYYTLLMPFSCSRSDFLVFFHVIKKSAIIKRALIGYDERMYYGTSMRELKGRTRGGEVQFFFLFFCFSWGNIFKLFCVIFYHFLLFLSFHELFSLKFRLARFLFLDFCTRPLKYLMASP